MKLKLSVLFVFSVVFLAACWPNPNTVISPTPITRFTQPASAKQPADYLIGVGDTLDIKFMYNPELNELAVPVRPDGRISLQLANDVPAANLTPDQLRKSLAEKYASELKKPEIAVIVRTFTHTGSCRRRGGIPGHGRDKRSNNPDAGSLSVAWVKRHCPA